MKAIVVLSFITLTLLVTGISGTMLTSLINLFRRPDPVVVQPMVIPQVPLGGSGFIGGAGPIVGGNVGNVFVDDGPAMYDHHFGDYYYDG